MKTFEKMLLLLNGGGVPVSSGEFTLAPGTEQTIEHRESSIRVMYLFSQEDNLEVSIDGINFFKMKHLISTDYKLTICGNKTITVRNNTAASATVVWSIWDYCPDLITEEIPQEILQASGSCRLG